MNAILEVCPVCREKQPVMKPWVIWFFLAAFLLAWAAFYRF
ncbi:MAG TPA: hypothetical protein VGR78_10620 [Verrucomicrobiae bacterium]|nr:hypothetical protein [Verrucomicrobiae bacterium]